MPAAASDDGLRDMLAHNRDEEVEHAAVNLGHDFSIGYDGHSGESVTLYLTEAFTFRVLEPAAVIAKGG